MINWRPTTEERYYEMRGVLPPASMGYRRGIEGFQVGEAMNHNANGEPTFATFKSEISAGGDKFYESAEAHTFREFKAEFPNAEYYYGE